MQNNSVFSFFDLVGLNVTTPHLISRTNMKHCTCVRNQYYNEHHEANQICNLVLIANSSYLTSLSSIISLKKVWMPNHLIYLFLVKLHSHVINRYYRASALQPHDLLSTPRTAISYHYIVNITKCKNVQVVSFPSLRNHQSQTVLINKY